MIILNAKYNEYLLIFGIDIYCTYTTFNKVRHLKISCYLYLFHVDQTKPKTILLIKIEATHLCVGHNYYGLTKNFSIPSTDLLLFSPFSLLEVS